MESIFFWYQIFLEYNVFHGMNLDALFFIETFTEFSPIVRISDITNSCLI